MGTTRKPPTKKKPAARAPAEKKPAPAKKKPVAPAKKKPAPASTDESIYTLDQLVQRVGGADESGARALIRGLSDENLIAIGRRVATPRITTDGRRLYGVVLDTLARLTAAQRTSLPTVTNVRVAAAIGALAHGRTLHEQRESAMGLRGARKDVAVFDALGVRDRARALRAQLVEVLIDLLGERPEIDAAAGNVSTGAALATSLDNLLDLLESKVLDTDLRAELQPGSYAAAERASIRATAKDARRLDEIAAAVQGVAEVPQSEVDLWDGINLTLLARLVAAFERGHDRDHTIPRLSYLSLRSWTRRLKSPAPATPPNR